MAAKTKKEKADAPVYSTETYPNVEVEQVGNAIAVLEQYRQSVIGQNPLPLEWLFDSLRDGDVKDLFGYVESIRQNEADHEAAIERAGGPFDASYYPPPTILGAEGITPDVDAGPAAPEPEPEVTLEDKALAEQEAADEDDGA